MWQNFYELENLAQEKIQSLRWEAEQVRLMRLVRSERIRRSYTRRALSGLGEKLIRVGVDLTRRYGDRCAENRALLEHILSLERAFPRDERANG